MKILDNKITEIRNEDGVDFCTYKDLIRIALNITPKGGFTREELRNRDRIEEAVNNAKDETISFEDQDAVNLNQILSTIAWAQRHKDIVAFDKAVENMLKQ